MNRRKFLGAIGATAAAIAAAGATASAAPAPDAFTHRGYLVRWRGWIEPTNQNVAIGMWNAFSATEKKMFASTTLGIATAHREMDCIDCTRVNGWPVISSFSSERERAEARERARVNIVRIIDAEGGHA